MKRGRVLRISDDRFVERFERAFVVSDLVAGEPEEERQLFVARFLLERGLELRK